MDKEAGPVRTRIVVGLVLAISTAALITAPVSGAPGKGTVVTRGEDGPCPVQATAYGVEEVSNVKWRWVEKRNGRPSKLFCRFKSATLDDSWAGVKRMRVEGTLALCPTPPTAAGDLLRARFKMNARGNGFLKCVYEAKA